MTEPEPAARPSFREASRLWAEVAIHSFGGPAGQIAVMHRLLVEKHGWVSESRFLHALNYCMLLPGPEAQQLATYIGWLLHRAPGGLVAGTLFVLPGFLSILALSVLYASYQETRLIQALFFGIKAAVIAVVIEAVLRIGKRALKNEVMVTLTVLAFLAIFFFKVPFPLIVLGAGTIGYLGGKVRLDKFYVVKGHEMKEPIDPPTRPDPRRTLRVIALWLVIWLLPLGLLVLALGRGHVLVQEGLFFSQAALVTFGGAYAVLAYIAQRAVETYGWLEPGEMLDGLGMAETTPGPLIQVIAFVGFLGAYRHPAGMDPLVAGVLGSIVTTWVTYAPSFLWIFAGAPYIEYLRGQKSLTTALSAITAAVVGVILNLAVWFSLYTLFGSVRESDWGPVHLTIPEWHTLDPVALAIAAGAMIAMLRFHVGMLPTLAVSGLLGAVAFWWRG
ncbi:MAG: chromate efflux transporter [Armatimonadetes bacterium]|nr:chromate efflux transporter [Armatimonadota bacterium]